MERTYNCPFCVRRGKGIDRRRNLNVNARKNMAHCFRCEWKTRDAKRALAPEGIRVVTSTVNPRRTPLPEPALPESFSTDFRTPFGARVLAYLLGRHLDRGTIFGYGLGYCTRGRYAGRVVIPIYEGGTLVTVQGRVLDPEHPGPKYLGEARPKDAVIFNWDRAAAAGVFVLTEGPFDALALPEFAVAALGKAWEPAHFARLSAARPRAIVVALDGDARATQTGVIARCYGLAPQVVDWHWAHREDDLGGCPPSVKASMHALCTSLASGARGAIPSGSRTPRRSSMRSWTVPVS